VMLALLIAGCVVAGLFCGLILCCVIVGLRRSSTTYNSMVISDIHPLNAPETVVPGHPYR
jgi:hypothetical protein